MSSTEQNVGVEANPPQHLVEQLETMKREWLRSDTFAYVELYNTKPHHPAGEWKYRIRRSGAKDILIEHLIPEKADGHTYMLMIRAMSIAADVVRRQTVCEIFSMQAITQALAHGIKIPEYNNFLETGNVETRPLP